MLNLVRCSSSSLSSVCVSVCVQVIRKYRKRSGKTENRKKYRQRGSCRSARARGYGVERRSTAVEYWVGEYRKLYGFIDRSHQAHIDSFIHPLRLEPRLEFREAPRELARETLLSRPPLRPLPS